jgi:hypothetical protein
MVETIKRRILQQILTELTPQSAQARRMRAGYAKSANENYGSYVKD